MVANNESLSSDGKSDELELQAILERRRKLEGEGSSIEDASFRKTDSTEVAFDSEVRTKLEKRRALSEDGGVAALD